VAVLARAPYAAAALLVVVRSMASGEKGFDADADAGCGRKMDTSDLRRLTSPVTRRELVRETERRAAAGKKAEERARGQIMGEEAWPLTTSESKSSTRPRRSSGSV